MHSFVSLFSGCGGFDLGFINNGYTCYGAFDNDPIAIENYKKNIGDWIYNCDLSLIKRLPINLPTNIDLVISGSPCQGYSTIGKREYYDPRNNLLIKGGEIAIEHNAKVFVAENVIGSIYGNHKQYWDFLTEMLKKSKYNVQIEIINSSDFGLAQTRKRVFLFAWRGNKKVNFTFQKSKVKTLKEALASITSKNDCGEFIEDEDPRAMICKIIKPGQKLCDVRGGERSVHSWEIPAFYGQCNQEEIRVLEELMILRRKLRKRKTGDADPVSIADLKKSVGFDCSVTIQNLINKGYVVRKNNYHYDLKRSFNGKFRRLSWDKPSFTVDTNFGNPNYFLHPEENRGFTVREAARIQSFSDDYIFFGNPKQQFKLIGNAVPPVISEIIAAFIKENIL